MTTQVWQHIVSGESYVVTTDSTGAIVDACGPLHYSEVASCLIDGFDGDVELVDDMSASADEYRLVETPYVYLVHTACHLCDSDAHNHRVGAFASLEAAQEYVAAEHGELVEWQEWDGDDLDYDYDPMSDSRLWIQRVAID